MGLRIDTTTNEVIVDHASREHLHTTRRGNPVQETVGVMHVDSIFRRKKASRKLQRNRQVRLLGDNCPLIYALKQQQGLWVSRNSVKILNAHIPQLVADVCGPLNGHVTCIVPIVSRYPLAEILAKHISKNLGVPVFNGVFQKATFFQASRRAHALLANRPAMAAAGLSWQDEKLLRNVMKEGMQQGGAPYSAKNVKTHLRQYFDPLRLAAGATMPATQDRVLFVDDLLATGETLLAAAALLQGQGIASVDRSVTWFSKV